MTNIIVIYTLFLFTACPPKIREKGTDHHECTLEVAEKGLFLNKTKMLKLISLLKLVYWNDKHYSHLHTLSFYCMSKKNKRKGHWSSWMHTGSTLKCTMRKCTSKTRKWTTGEEILKWLTFKRYMLYKHKCCCSLTASKLLFLFFVCLC